MTIARRFIAMLFALLLVAPAFAQAPVQAQRAYSQAELDRMLAPVALYPDPLLSQVLMAATYPAEVMEAAQWSRAHPGLQGDDAVRAAADQDWDPSVKSLLAFPQLLARMDENIEWTQSLGDAFLGQEPLVMDTVQQLRRRAYAQGNLRSDERIHVQPQGEIIVIAPAVAEVVYLPYYDPLVVYGDWWWPDYRPIYWAPWYGYARHHHFWWGSPIRLSIGFFFGGFDWRNRHVHIHHVRSHYINTYRYRNYTAGRWQHDGRRRDESRQRIVERSDRRELRERLERAEQRTERRQEARQDARQDARRDERRDARRDERRGDTAQERREQLREQIRQRSQETRPERREERRDERREERRGDAAQETREQMREQLRQRAQEARPEQREQRQEWREQRREQMREQIRDNARERSQREAVQQPRQEAPRFERREVAPQVQREAPRFERREAPQVHREAPRFERPAAPQVQQREAPRVQQMPAPRVQQMPAPRQAVQQERREARQEARQERREERLQRRSGS